MLRGEYKGGAWVSMQDITGQLALLGLDKVWKGDNPLSILVDPVGDAAAAVVRQGKL